MGLADVHLTLAGFGILTGVEMALRGRTTWAALFVAAGAFTARSSLGAWALAAASLAHNLTMPPSNHVGLLFWTALAVAVVSGDELGSVFRVLTASVYGFAVANKLIGGVGFLAWHITTRGGMPEPLASIAAVGAVVMQAFLVWAVLRSHWTALPAAAALHFGITVVMSDSLMQLVAMTAFNALMVWLVYKSRPSHT